MLMPACANSGASTSSSSSSSGATSCTSSTKAIHFSGKNPKRVALVWFKRDLRVHDHAPLWEALASRSTTSAAGKTEDGHHHVDFAPSSVHKNLPPSRVPGTRTQIQQDHDFVLPVYILEPTLWKTCPDLSRRHYLFLQDCVRELQKDLQQLLGLQLFFKVGEVVETLEALRSSFQENGFSVQTLYSHQETWNYWTYQRDRKVRRFCKAHGIRWREPRQTGVVRRLKNRDGWAKQWEIFMREKVLDIRKVICPGGVPEQGLSAFRFGCSLEGQTGVDNSENKCNAHPKNTHEDENVRSSTEVCDKSHRAASTFQEVYAACGDVQFGSFCARKEQTRPKDDDPAAAREEVSQDLLQNTGLTGRAVAPSGAPAKDVATSTRGSNSTPSSSWFPPPSAFDLVDDHCIALQKGGRRNAIWMLESFLAERASNYSRNISSPITAWEGCARLSPHLAFGTISLREVFQATEKKRGKIAEEKKNGNNKTRNKRPQGQGQDYGRSETTSATTATASVPSAVNGRDLNSFASRLRWHCHFGQKLEDEPLLEFRNLHSGYNGIREENAITDAEAVAISQWAVGWVAGKKTFWASSAHPMASADANNDVHLDEQEHVGNFYCGEKMPRGPSSSHPPSSSRLLDAILGSIDGQKAAAFRANNPVAVVRRESEELFRKNAAPAAEGESASWTSDTSATGTNSAHGLFISQTKLPIVRIPPIQTSSSSGQHYGQVEQDRSVLVDKLKFLHWASGTTGYPMVDGCMRALTETGWVNFRMRAMLCSFATFHLWLHWRPVAIHLARLFTDYEPGIHYPQVQMQAGTTGINTIRCYNPIKQSEDQDPDGRFLKRWLPARPHEGEEPMKNNMNNENAAATGEQAYNYGRPNEQGVSLSSSSTTSTGVVGGATSSTLVFPTTAGISAHGRSGVRIVQISKDATAGAAAAADLERAQKQPKAKAGQRKTATKARAAAGAAAKTREKQDKTKPSRSVHQPWARTEHDPDAAAAWWNADKEHKDRQKKSKGNKTAVNKTKQEQPTSFPALSGVEHEKASLEVVLQQERETELLLQDLSVLLEAQVLAFHAHFLTDENTIYHNFPIADERLARRYAMDRMHTLKKHTAVRSEARKIVQKHGSRTGQNDRNHGGGSRMGVGDDKQQDFQFAETEERPPMRKGAAKPKANQLQVFSFGENGEKKSTAVRKNVRNFATGLGSAALTKNAPAFRGNKRPNMFPDLLAGSEDESSNPERGSDHALVLGGTDDDDSFGKVEAALSRKIRKKEDDHGSQVAGVLQHNINIKNHVAASTASSTGAPKTLLQPKSNSVTAHDFFVSTSAGRGGSSSSQQASKSKIIINSSGVGSSAPNSGSEVDNIFANVIAAANQQAAAGPSGALVVPRPQPAASFVASDENQNRGIISGHSAVANQQQSGPAGTRPRPPHAPGFAFVGNVLNREPPLLIDLTGEDDSEDEAAAGKMVQKEEERDAEKALQPPAAGPQDNKVQITSPATSIARENYTSRPEIEVIEISDSDIYENEDRDQLEVHSSDEDEEVGSCGMMMSQSESDAALDDDVLLVVDDDDDDGS
ncbi:unnamed protein product [Amoebophrya sp. A120]|nr:unnamed protein product [Amoebophrya sp. A120]|eukprot:GSA120T00011986001.1